MKTFQGRTLTCALLVALGAPGCDDGGAVAVDAAVRLDQGAAGDADVGAPVRDAQVFDMAPIGDAQVQVAERLMTWVCDTRFAQEASDEDLQLIGVTHGAGTVGIEITPEPCAFHLVHRAEGATARLSATPAGYLLAAGVASDAAQVICASRIEHREAEDGGEPDPEGMRVQRETTGVALECFAQTDGGWSAPQVIIAPTLDFAPWVTGIDLRDDGAFELRYDRDFSFQFLNLTQVGRPAEDGAYAIELRLTGDGIEAGAPEKLTEDLSGAPVSPDADDACPPDFEAGDPRCAARCGDNSCDPGETCADCPQDCGACSAAVDDADQPGYVEILGEWETGPGLGETSRYSDDGVAAFAVDALRPGYKELWVHHPGGADATPNAYYRIVEGEGRVVAEVIEDQRDAPADWRLLGTVYTQGDFVVEVTKSGPGRLYADAIRVEVVEPPEPMIDDAGGQFRQLDGAWQAGDGGEGGAHRTSTDGHGEYATPIMPGVYEVSVFYPAVPMASQRAEYTLGVDDVVAARVVLNQRNQAGAWISLGYFALNGLRARLTLTSLDGLPIVADAVRFEARPALVGGGEFVVDDGDALYSEAGLWSASAQPGVDGDARWSRAPDATAAWQFSGLAPDDYDVLAWVDADERSTIAAEYQISAGGVELARVSVDQSAQSGWVELGRFAILTPTARITLRQAAAGNLRADQIKLVSTRCEICER